MTSEFFVRHPCRFRRLAGGKSRYLQDVHGGKVTVRCAAELIRGSLNTLRPLRDIYTMIVHFSL